MLRQECVRKRQRHRRGHRRRYVALNLDIVTTNLQDDCLKPAGLPLMWRLNDAHVRRGKMYQNVNHISEFLGHLKASDISWELCL